jgi:broad specificity phosphatase PhoE
LVGEKQVQQLRNAIYPRIEKLQIELIVTSPMTRTLQTCLRLFEQLAVQKVFSVLMQSTFCII